MEQRFATVFFGLRGLLLEAVAPRLKGVSEGVSQVQGLAQTLLVRVGSHYLLLHAHRVGNHPLQALPHGVLSGNVEGGQFGPHLFVGNQSVLKHLGIAAEKVGLVEGREEVGIEYDELAVAEHAHLVFQSAEVDARLSAHACVDHCEQRGGYVDEVDASLEC